MMGFIVLSSILMFPGGVQMHKRAGTVPQVEVGQLMSATTKGLAEGKAAAWFGAMADGRASAGLAIAGRPKLLPVGGKAKSKELAGMKGVEHLSLAQPTKSGMKSRSDKPGFAVPAELLLGGAKPSLD